MKLEFGKYYHIYNRGNNRQVIFSENEDYEYFLKLIRIYLPSAFEVFAYCLMKNHYHLCLKVKERNELEYFDNRQRKNTNLEMKWRVYSAKELEPQFRKEINPNSMLKFLFNSHARWFNLKYNRTGSLCEKNFERKLIEDEDHLLNEIVYINANAVKHKVVEKPKQYEWSSFNEVVSGLGNIVERQFLIEKFGDIDNFIFVHENKAFK